LLDLIEEGMDRFGQGEQYLVQGAVIGQRATQIDQLGS
jgi:hypothetical protein